MIRKWVTMSIEKNLELFDNNVSKVILNQTYKAKKKTFIKRKNYWKKN